jgi:hypothetical protein
MAAEEESASTRGRASIDWQQAFQFYAALPPERRDYRQVAAHFGVSVRTVERHGLNERWRDRAAAIDAEAAARAAAELSKERAAKLGDVEVLIDGSFVSYAQQLREGRVRLTAADLGRLHKLRRELWDEQLQDAPGNTRTPAPEHSDERAHKLALLRALQDAGAFERLQRLAAADEGEVPE